MYFLALTSAATLLASRAESLVPRRLRFLLTSNCRSDHANGDCDQLWHRDGFSCDGSRETDSAGRTNGSVSDVRTAVLVEDVQALHPRGVHRVRGASEQAEDEASGTAVLRAAKGGGDLRTTCKAIGCREAIGSQFLMCRGHWSKVPKELQDEVYRTFRARNSVMDATWAPWWRAQARAVAAIHPWVNETAKELWLSHEESCAVRLERA